MLEKYKADKICKGSARFRFALSYTSGAGLIAISGIDASVKDENTYTPLHAAVSWGHADILRLLVSRGGNINVQDEDGECVSISRCLEIRLTQLVGRRYSFASPSKWLNSSSN